MTEEIKISLEYAKDIYKVLEDMVSMGYDIISYEMKNIISKEAYNKLVKIHMKYHNANCGPFNRYLKKLIEEKESSPNLNNTKEEQNGK